MEVSETVPLRFPFLGSLENGEPFQYLVLSIGGDVAEIALLQWFLNRIQLHIGDKIDLHLPYHHLTTNFKLRGDILGTVIDAKHSEDNQGEIYQVSLSKTTDSDAKYYLSDQYTKQLEVTTSLTDLVINLIKDTMILKSGIRIYFKHLTPYFSRISDYSHQEYEKLKKYFLHDIELRIIDNEAKLKKIYQNAKEKITKPEEIAAYIDLESLREIIESEISLSVFNVVFSEEKIPNLSIFSNPQTGILMYINAIKNLEERLYSNYNHIVILYLKSII